VALEDAVHPLQSLSRVCAPPWHYTALDGSEQDAVETLGLFHAHAVEAFRGRDEETDAVLDLWDRVLGGLAANPESLVGILDWVSKKFLLETFMESEDLEWSDPWLLAQDLEYHQADPRASLGLAMASDSGGPWEPDTGDAALMTPPRRTRARKRSELMDRASTADRHYTIDWDHVQVRGEIMEALMDPYEWE
jgi:proteasome accessory factor A